MLFGIVNFSILVQCMNALSPIERTEFPRFTSFRFSQLINEAAPTEVTESGSITVVNSVRPPNAPVPIEVTEYSFPSEVAVEGISTYAAVALGSNPVNSTVSSSSGI